MNNEENPDTHLPDVENPGSAGTHRHSGRQYHQHSTNFEQGIGESSPSNCEVCGCSIPPNRFRCSDHRQSGSEARTNSEFEWSFSHIAIAVVPASNIFHAAAMGNSAFFLRDDSDSKDSFDLIYDFNEPSKTFTSGWSETLPDAVPIDSEDGQRLLECAKKKTNWGGVLDVEKALGVDESPLSDSKAYIFSEGGEEITEKEQLESMLDESEKELWVVPAALYNRKRNTSGKTIRNRPCPSCDARTKHVFDEYDGGHPSLHTGGVAIWVCLECETSHAGSPPTGSIPDEPWEDDNFAGGDRRNVDTAADEQHRAVMNRLDDEGKLD
ncbi:hypothetical protein [Haloarcula sp. H-GB5]